MWVMGGRKGLGWFNDVWRSTDGANWTMVTGSAGWQPRVGHSAIAFDNRLWVMGGVPPNTYSGFNDVWYSTDGANWTCAVDSAEWRPRGWHSSAVHDDKLWVIGGDSTINCLATGDVWSSSGLGLAETRNAEVRASNLPTIIHGKLPLAPYLIPPPSSLFSLDGRKVLDLKSGANDVSALSPGVYFVREPETGNGRPNAAVQKVVVTR